MCIEYCRFDSPSKRPCILNFCKLRDVPRFIITRICKPQIRQELASALPPILCKRAHDATLDIRLRIWLAALLPWHYSPAAPSLKVPRSKHPDGGKGSNGWPTGPAVELEISTH